MNESAVLQRLRDAGLRPTMARISILKLIDASSPASLGAEEVFGRLMEEGVQPGLGTVYRVLQELHACGLLVREWGAQRSKALYRTMPPGATGQAVHLVCPESGRIIALDDERLRQALVDAAAHHEVDLSGRVLRIEAEQRANAAMLPLQGRRASATKAHRPSQRKPLE